MPFFSIFEKKMLYKLENIFDEKLGFRIQYCVFIRDWIVIWLS